MLMVSAIEYKSTCLFHKPLRMADPLGLICSSNRLTRQINPLDSPSATCVTRFAPPYQEDLGWNRTVNDNNLI